MISSRAAILALSALALLSSFPAQASDGSLLRKKQIVEDSDPEDAHRELDASWSSPTDPPTGKPSKRPTRKPTRKPTRRPTQPPTRDLKPPPGGHGYDVCGTIPCAENNGLLLGEFKQTSWVRTPESFDCNHGHGHWFYRTVYSPSYAYKFALTKTCEYQYLAPEFDNQWKTTRDVNTWFETMATVLKREGHAGYKASDDDLIFNGNEIPVWKRDVIERNIPECPEKYCIKVIGPAVSRRSFLAGGATDAPTEFPTEAPSDSPTTSPTLPALATKDVGVNPNDVLGRCEGDCDNDKHCGDGLVCFQRNGYETIPGCLGTGSKMWDYCVVGQKEASNPPHSTALTDMGNNGNPASAFPLGMCQGDCDTDAECKEGLICQQRHTFEEVPGCNGGGSRGWDYCRKPDYVNPNQPAILYAFSHEQAWADFRVQLKGAMETHNKDHIFLTNHFRRCGCDSFCYGSFKHWNGYYGGATCYVEPLCGRTVFQIHYDDDYPMDKRVDWADTGTTEILKWFDACAGAMYGCTEFTDFDQSRYVGTKNYIWHGSYKGYLKKFLYDTLDVSPLPEILNIGGNPNVIMAECQGDCDYDYHCADGLVCQQRNGNENIPGCQGMSHNGWDYCIRDPATGSKFPKLNPIGWSPPYPLGLCDGDCDQDKHCEGDLVCSQRNGYEPINGCAGTGTKDMDYCAPKDAPAPTQAPTAGVSISTYHNVYGLGGDKYYGIPSNHKDKMAIGWECPSMARRDELERFGEFLAKSELFRDPGDDDVVPEVPCPKDTYEPKYPEKKPVTPGCENFDESVYCYQMNGATCYATIEDNACDDVVFKMENATGTYRYEDVAEWNDACLASGNKCRRREDYEDIDGEITYKGTPNGVPYWSDTYKWSFGLYNQRKNGQNTISGNKKTIYYTCESWEGAYASANFTDGVGNKYNIFDNAYGDLYESKLCTDSPSQPPSAVPTASFAPSETPSQNPTLCTESYLTSEDLNIALVIDLSFSTYQKEFSAQNPVGDVNGDGKGNTILDAQVVAIQELLTSIAKSPTLNNKNSEINIISFSTDAKDHGVWGAINSAGDDYNENLMNYIKKNLRAPTSSDQVFKTNNGFTNFDAALDKTVEYFENKATKNRKNLVVFLSDGEPNVRGDGDEEGYCADTVIFWKDQRKVNCKDLRLKPGEKHDFCRGNDADCNPNNIYQDCVRGPNNCMNSDAAMSYESEINALTELGVERLAIGVGSESNIAEGSALWMIDNNPAKELGVLPLQALNLDELSDYLSSLCILNTEPPTGSPSASPTLSPTVSPAPSSVPTKGPTTEPSGNPSGTPTTDAPSDTPTGMPTDHPTTESPTDVPTQAPTDPPTTETPTDLPTQAPTNPPFETLPPFTKNDKETPAPESECPSDLVVSNQKGTVTDLPRGTVKIISQDRQSVTVQLKNTYSKPGEALDGFYYQYQYSEFSTKCYDKDDILADEVVEVTIQCRIHSPVAVLELWVADGVEKGTLSGDDNSEIPKCCHPDEPEGTPSTHYVMVIKCLTDCPGTVG